MDGLNIEEIVRDAERISKAAREPNALTYKQAILQLTDIVARLSKAVQDMKDAS